MGLDIKLANKTTEITNKSVSKIIASKAVGVDIINRNYSTDALARAAGLGIGDIYHFNGDLKVVVNYNPV